VIARAFPYDRPCRFQKFEATETILATGTTIWKPGFSPHQYGFRAGLSCTRQLIHLFHTWASALNKGKTTDVVFLDFEKAFDSVPHDHVISKLRRYGICGQILE